MPTEPEHDAGEHEVWKPSPPPPPMPDFPKIPDSLRKAAGGEPSKPSGLAGIGKGWALALDFVGSIIAAWLIGFLIDRWQKTAPWGSLIGLCIGFAYAIYRILKQTKQDERESKR
jgi:F0F1-type ATP synthase assembly protein I